MSIHPVNIYVNVRNALCEKKLVFHLSARNNMDMDVLSIDVFAALMPSACLAPCTVEHRIVREKLLSLSIVRAVPGIAAYHFLVSLPGAVYKAVQFIMLFTHYP